MAISYFSFDSKVSSVSRFISFFKTSSSAGSSSNPHSPLLPFISFKIFMSSPVIFLPASFSLISTVPDKSASSIPASLYNFATLFLNSLASKLSKSKFLNSLYFLIKSTIFPARSPAMFAVISS